MAAYPSPTGRTRGDSAAEHPLIMAVDPLAEVFYKPRTVTVMVVGLCLLAYFSEALVPGSRDFSWEERGKHGAWALVGTFLAYSALYAPHTLMIRPHPIVWRVVHGMTLLYMLFLVLLLFMGEDQARQSLKYLYPELGVPLDERAYGNDCRVYTPDHPESKFANIRDTVLDEFVLAHLFGWVAKGLIFRDWKILLFLSIGFELMELTFNHMLPNFNECWWDSWILDVVLCNNIGMIFGLYLIKARRRYGDEWVGVSSQPTIFLKVKRLFLQFTPESVETYDWQMLSSPKRCVQCLTLAAFCLACEVNAFFLKFVLWVPPRNPLNTYRLFIFFLMVIPAVNEYYDFITRPEVNKLGVFTWIFLSCTIIEFLIIIKFGREFFDLPWPYAVKVSWVWAASATAVALCVWTIRLKQKSKLKTQ